MLDSTVIFNPEEGKNTEQQNCDDMTRSLDELCAGVQTLARLPRVPDVIALSALADRMAALLREVRFIENRNAPIGKLPSELLGVVFKMVQDDLLSGLRSPRKLKEAFAHYVPWISILGVCRRWRDVGFAASPLWTTVFVQARPSIALFDSRSYVRRSANCPLTVFLSLAAEPKDLFKVLAQMPRIRELTIEVDDVSTRSLTLPLRWCIPGHELKVLTFITPTRSYIGNRDIPKLFSGQLSHLLAFQLTRVANISQYNCASLRHLHLYRFLFIRWQDVESLLNLLSATPALEDLMFTLPDGRDFEDVFAERNRAYVELPHLRRLAVMMNGRGVGTLLCRLRIPAGVSMSFPGVKPFESGWYSSDVFPRDRTGLKNLSDLHDLELRFVDSTIVTRGVGISSAFFARWRFGWPRGVSFSTWNVPFVVHPSRRLWFDLSHLWSRVGRRRDYMDAFRACAPNVRALFLTGRDDESVVPDLVELLGIAEGGPNTEMANLEEIHFTRHTSDDYAQLRLALFARQTVRKIIMYETAPCESAWGEGDRENPRNPACLEEYVPNVSIVAGPVPEMKWVDICASQSDGPWHWPVWTKNGDCSVTYDPDTELMDIFEDW